MKPNKLYAAHMECVGCGVRWVDLPRGPSHYCPKNCGSKYLKWLNYDETFAKHHYSELGDWDETYGKLSQKQIKKLLRRG